MNYYLVFFRYPQSYAKVIIKIIIGIVFSMVITTKSATVEGLSNAPAPWG
jgi:hypothetical protein